MRCVVCRRDIEGNEPRVVLGAFGRPWFAAHGDPLPCHNAVREIMRSSAVVALGALKTTLRKRSPTALKVTEGVAIGMQLVRQARDQQRSFE